MNAFDAAEKSGRAPDLQKELGALFDSQNKSPSKDATSIPATFLVSVETGWKRIKVLSCPILSTAASHRSA
jgi:hypothetical protein